MLGLSARQIGVPHTGKMEGKQEECKEEIEDDDDDDDSSSDEDDDEGDHPFSYAELTEGTSVVAPAAAPAPAPAPPPPPPPALAPPAAGPPDTDARREESLHLGSVVAPARGGATHSESLPTPVKQEFGWNENSIPPLPSAVHRRPYLLDLVCRAHQVVEDGYEFFGHRKLVTVFSAPNYCKEFDNCGAIMTVAWRTF